MRPRAGAPVCSPRLYGITCSFPALALPPTQSVQTKCRHRRLIACAQLAAASRCHDARGAHPVRAAWLRAQCARRHLRSATLLPHVRFFRSGTLPALWSLSRAPGARRTAVHVRVGRATPRPPTLLVRVAPLTDLGTLARLRCGIAGVAQLHCCGVLVLGAACGRGSRVLSHARSACLRMVPLCADHRACARDAARGPLPAHGAPSPPRGSFSAGDNECSECT
ncbi:hypothetical protein TRVL_06645 [Trypanosoma vivax]|nr:hypothetical protein TRVL_06645 [Trypanosoma vivax]